MAGNRFRENRDIILHPRGERQSDGIERRIGGAVGEKVEVFDGVVELDGNCGAV